MEEREDEDDLGVGSSLTREKRREAKHYSLSFLEFPRYFPILTSCREHLPPVCQELRLKLTPGGH